MTAPANGAVTNPAPAADSVARAVLDRAISMRNIVVGQREALRDQLQALTDLVERVITDDDLEEPESRALFDLDRGYEEARRLLLSLPPKFDADAEPTVEDRDQSG